MWIAISAILAAAATGPGWPQPEAEAERRLEAGIHREMVLGDLKGAMEEYRALVGHAAGSKAVGSKAVEARALFQMAQCQEKLGRHTDALATYRRVTAEYRGTDGAVRAQARLADLVDNAPGPRNLKFEEGEVGKMPPGWQVWALPSEAADLAELRRTGCRSGVGCAVVLVPSNAPRPFGYMGQSFNAAPYRGRTVRLGAWLRLEPRSPGDLITSWLRMEAPAAEDSAQMRLSVDRQNHRSGFFDNMENRPVRSAEWTRCEIVGTIDNDARFIEIAVMSIGRGRAWVDDVSFEVVK
ncbi:MAG TPA: tetratricopeptide repeat protein [Bryobacteraceae bacterium]|nr:tetratricopeptide repeat protein [Bryobacteraceae bacterium]